MPIWPSLQVGEIAYVLPNQQWVWKAHPTFSHTYPKLSVPPTLCFESSRTTSANFHDGANQVPYEGMWVLFDYFLYLGITLLGNVHSFMWALRIYPWDASTYCGFKLNLESSRTRLGHPMVTFSRRTWVYAPLLNNITCPIPHRQETFCLSTKLRPSRHFTLADGVGSPPTASKQYNFLVWSLMLTYDHSICIHVSRRCQLTSHLPHSGKYWERYACWNLGSPGSHSHATAVPGHRPTQIAISPRSHLRLRCFWAF